MLYCAVQFDFLFYFYPSKTIVFFYSTKENQSDL